MGPDMAKSTDDKYGITQFAGTNFPSLKFRVETLLEEFGVRACLTDIEPSSTQRVELEKWQKDDKKCKSLIVQCVADSHLEYVMAKNLRRKSGIR